jgi:hypothetical protein
MAEIELQEELGEDGQEDVLPLFAELGPVGFQPYVLDLASMGHGTQANGSTLNDGLTCPTRIGSPSMHAEPLALVGPHTRLLAQAAAVDEDAIAQEPEPVPGEAITTLLVDFNVGVI